MYAKVLNEFVDLIFEQAVIAGYSNEDLAKKANVAISTVYRLMYGDTKLPRLRTVFVLAQAVGLNIMITKLKLRKVG
jgi:transcriptional regulator with XRE-family HTH domain